MTWESVNTFFNRLELATERESARLRKTERLMQDYVGRPNAHSWANGSALFEEAAEHVNRVDPGRTPRYDADEGRYEAASMREAETLRQSFRPRRPKKKTLSHVRPPRPVAPDVVAYAATLGVTVA